MAIIQGSLFGKTSKVVLPQTTEMTSALFSESSADSCNSKCLRCDQRSGNPQGRFWEITVPSHGESLTPNTGESPNVERESSLSAILEDNPLRKYVLSRKACAGILQRAKRRGKNLPERLERALITQMESGQKNQ